MMLRMMAVMTAKQQPEDKKTKSLDMAKLGRTSRR
jgi:hypothetical protein